MINLRLKNSKSLIHKGFFTLDRVYLENKNFEWNKGARENKNFEWNKGARY